MVSNDNGSTWNNVYPDNYGNFTSIACDSSGYFVFAACSGDGLYMSMNFGNFFYKVYYSDNTLPGGVANPEVTDPAFAGYGLSDISQIACDASGINLIMTTNAGASIYRSTDSGASWAFIYAIPGYSTTRDYTTYVASNADGSILYAALNNTAEKNIIVSKDSGVTWTSMNMLGLSGPFTSLRCNYYGDIVFCISNNSSLNIFYPTHVDKALLTPSPGNTLITLASYNAGNNIIIAQNTYETITNGAIVVYSLTNKYEPAPPPPPPPPPPVPCFKDDSKILCFKEGIEVYVKVQDMRKGDLVKTLKHGYLPVNMIGTSKLYNSGDALRGQNRLYLCSVEQYPSLTEDLVITGCHSILEDFITEKQREGTIDIVGRIMVTDAKYRLMAFLDERATPYLEEGNFNIWHIALDNDNYYMNYGIYANGLLVETCSKRYLKELSGMRLME